MQRWCVQFPVQSRFASFPFTAATTIMNSHYEEDVKNREDDTRMFPLFNRFHLLRIQSETHSFARLHSAASPGEQPQLQLLHSAKAYVCNPLNPESCSVVGTCTVPSIHILSYILSNPSTCAVIIQSSSPSVKLHLKLLDNRSLLLEIVFTLSEASSSISSSLLNSLHSSLLSSVFALYSLNNNFRDHQLYQHRPLQNGVKDLHSVISVNQIDKGLTQTLKKSLNVDCYVTACKTLTIAGVAEKEQLEENERRRKRKELERQKTKNMRDKFRLLNNQGTSRTAKKTSLFNDDDDDDDIDDINYDLKLRKEKKEIPKTEQDELKPDNSTKNNEDMENGVKTQLSSHPSAQQQKSLDTKTNEDASQTISKSPETQPNNTTSPPTKGIKKKESATSRSTTTQQKKKRKKVKRLV